MGRRGSAAAHRPAVSHDVLREAGALWHQLLAEQLRHVRHAVAAHAIGPYLPQSGVAFPIFSHEPTLAVAPTGETAMFFTHLDRPATFAGKCTCTDGNSTAACPPDWDKYRGRDPSLKLLTYLSLTKDFQHWSEPVPVLPQADPYSDTAHLAQRHVGRHDADPSGRWERLAGCEQLQASGVLQAEPLRRGG